MSSVIRYHHGAQSRKAQKGKGRRIYDPTKGELFCRFYVQNAALFANATLSYAEAYDYKLDTLSNDAVYSEPGEDGKRKKLDDSEYDKAYHVCAVEGSTLLKNPDIQARITTLLNEMLKDEVVDSQLAKLILQDDDSRAKIEGIKEYNKLRGRIIDKSKIQIEKFAMDDLRALLAPLPTERQDQVYEIITAALAEAEALRGTQEI